ncbi:Benzyl alcohol O-benzoyltransferase [Quillaja saponaria]|uniref:Benzyl alcohol O-benzoyltransferase n=1 Tax=Quillaja saponaria TaxID=32244 RepID=A0AAD7P6K2_QUISA|nr:Benzyl alcohol O-benzoyltransferase [Quillaja saponaria]
MEVSCNLSPIVFSTRHSEPELVVPAEPTPNEVKLLSDIDDQEGLRFHLPIIKFYHHNPISIMKGEDPVKVIREAIAKALVFYYPFAGRLREGPNRKLMVDCNGEGVLFVEADADVELWQLGDTVQPPCPYMREFLNEVPGSEGIIGCPLLLIQVTRLRCGGFVFVIRMNHTMCDTLGLVRFLNMVAEFSRGKCAPTQVTQLPVWQRHILNARDPPTVAFTHQEYGDVIDEKTYSLAKHVGGSDNEVVHDSVFFGPKEILSIREKLPPPLQNCSDFELLSACLWKCRTIALEPNPNDIVGLSCFINARGKNGLQVPNGYYGNAFAFPIALSKAGLLSQSPLGYALDLIRKVKTLMSEEFIRSVADLMVIKGRPMYRTVGNYLVADTTRVGFDCVDFGWGKPVYGGPAGAISCVSFYARFKNCKGEDGIVVPIWLPRSVMENFRSELQKIITQDPLNDHSYTNTLPKRSIISKL